MSKFLKTLGLEQALRFDSSASPLLYLGVANPGVLDTQPNWQITLINTTTGVTMTYPNGDASFLYQWSARASYTYV